MCEYTLPALPSLPAPTDISPLTVVGSFLRVEIIIIIIKTAKAQEEENFSQIGDAAVRGSQLTPTLLHNLDLTRDPSAANYFAHDCYARRPGR